MRGPLPSNTYASVIELHTSEEASKGTVQNIYRNLNQYRKRQKPVIGVYYVFFCELYIWTVYVVIPRTFTYISIDIYTTHKGLQSYFFTCIYIVLCVTAT